MLRENVHCERIPPFILHRRRLIIRASSGVGLSNFCEVEKKDTCNGQWCAKLFKDPNSKFYFELLPFNFAQCVHIRKLLKSAKSLHPKVGSREKFPYVHCTVWLLNGGLIIIIQTSRIMTYEKFISGDV